MKIVDSPLEERPREKALKYGFDSLSTIELLALILRTGNKQESVLEMSQRLLNEIGGLAKLEHSHYQQLISIKGIKKAKAVSILAVLELAKRLVMSDDSITMIKEPQDAYYYIYNKVRFEKQEKVILLCLNTHLEVIKEKVLFIGSDDMSVISGKEIFKETIMCGSSRVILIHNHPSGHPDPSLEDVEVTRRLEKMAKDLEIEWIDHIIIGKNCFYSFAAKRVIEM